MTKSINFHISVLFWISLRLQETEFINQIFRFLEKIVFKLVSPVKNPYNIIIRNQISRAKK